MHHSIYDVGLERNAANHVPLTPLGFLARSAAIYPSRTAIVHGELRRSYQEFHQRSLRLASALVRAGVQPGETVAAMLPNVPAMLEAHFGVPMAGAVLNSLNIRLDAETIAFMLQHSETKVLLTDPEFAPVIAKALALMETKPLVVDVLDTLAPSNTTVGTLEYEAFLETGDPTFQPLLPQDEWQAISLNYTSGTTGNPKGVVYHHRGAYLNAMGNGMVWHLPDQPVYLWTLPMFHCNGWCFPWTITAYAGTHVCLRRVEATAMFEAIAQHGVTHMCGAPIVMGMLINATADQRKPLPHPVQLMT
ncbi:MAG: AMP-binding protein, partial [Alphaproteobacteria bacterium]|nr:AMP-binding protein [Alphaproteobacteria bacterium]